MNNIEQKLKKIGKGCFIDFFPFFLEEDYHFNTDKKATDVSKLIHKQNPKYTRNSCETRACTIKSLLKEDLDAILSNIISSSDKVDKSAKDKAKKHLEAYRAGIPMHNSLKITVSQKNEDIDPYPDELTRIERLPEGAKKSITVNAYERNPKARTKCIEHYGLSCSVCDFKFESTYGNIGKDFIHVHHLIQLSDIEEEYEVDPVKDLRPVCPNCHAMLHKKNPPYTIAELKQHIKDSSTNLS